MCWSRLGPRECDEENSTWVGSRKRVTGSCLGFLGSGYPLCSFVRRRPRSIPACRFLSMPTPHGGCRTGHSVGLRMSSPRPPMDTCGSGRKPGWYALMAYGLFRGPRQKASNYPAFVFFLLRVRAMEACGLEPEAVSPTG